MPQKLSYVKPTKVQLKDHPLFSEKWLQERIVEDPTILGLGDLEVKDVERRHPKAGRLDLLLRDPDSGKRYEVEIMLGAVDESHIIRTIEYWDIERKRYPQFDHCAVLVAEEITSRFLNVINIINSHIPLIALQVNALQIGDNITLGFTKVLDEIVLGDDEDDDNGGQQVDRKYWEDKGSKKSLKIVDECFDILREIDADIQIKFNKYYIGLTIGGRSVIFVLFRAKKAFARVEVRLVDKAAWKSRLEDENIPVLESAKAKPRLSFQLSTDAARKNRDLLRELFEAAYRNQFDE
ncbi:MAG: hypothetical protein P9L99_13195 [Candidatus Lernaella stagnicola]|nr:hypothetical protein [Candidatus Lernaella stagnicola]